VWKASDQHVFSDRFLAEIQYAHIGNNFTLTFQEPSQRDVQPRFDIATSIWGRSFNESVFLRPTDSIDLTASYFLPGTLGGDHALKMGYRNRWARGDSISHTGGNAVARFANATTSCSSFANLCDTDLFRDGSTSYDLKTQAIYVQDTLTMNRLTLNLGVRWDYQRDEALATTVPANPLFPNLMPAIDFPGADSGVTWNDWSPRLGFTYDLSGTGRSLVRGSYSMYFGQMGPGQLAGNLVAISQVSIRYPWADLNGDTFVQPNEVNTSVPFLTKSAAFDPNNPTSFSSPGRVDPDVKNDRTREFIAGFQQELMRNLGFEVNYVWRKYDQFAWSDRDNYTSDGNFSPRTATPTCTGNAICVGPITYYVANVQQPSPFVYTNQPGRVRDYNGFELAVNKRYSDRWMANASFAYNDAIDRWESTDGFEDPTNINNLNGFEFAPESGGSGLDSIFTNAKWLSKASGMYTMKWNINLSGNVQFRQGYPYPIAIQVTNRGSGLGNINVLQEPLGERRLENVFIADFGVNKAFTFGTVRLIPSMDIFNITNANTTQSHRRVMGTYNHATGLFSQSATANDISSIIAPRVIRFGLRMNW
jgi:hypothetical protein